MKWLIKFLFKILPTEQAYAHCDIPCGIYDPRAAQVASATVLKMVQQIKELKVEGEDALSKLNYKNALTRRIMNKEEHAQICKRELLILWTDYFKPEHLEKFPELHDTIWQAAKLCSKNKQSVDEDSARELVEAANKVAEIFAETKK